jgi:hypothetical protein
VLLPLLRPSVDWRSCLPSLAQREASTTECWSNINCLLCNINWYDLDSANLHSDISLICNIHVHVQ